MANLSLLPDMTCILSCRTPGPRAKQQLTFNRLLIYMYNPRVHIIIVMHMNYSSQNQKPNNDYRFDRHRPDMNSQYSLLKNTYIISCYHIIIRIVFEGNWPDVNKTS